MGYDRLPADTVRGGGDCTDEASVGCEPHGYCNTHGLCACVGRWTGEYCTISFEESLGSAFSSALMFFLIMNIIFLISTIVLLFLGRFQVRRRPLWVYYQHLSTVLLFFAAITRTAYFSVTLILVSNGTATRNSLTANFLFGFYFPLLVSVCGLQLLVWAEIGKTSGRKKIAPIFHVVNFTLFVAEVVIIVLYGEIEDPKKLQFMGTLWRSYTIFVCLVQLLAFCYCGFQAFRDYDFWQCDHKDSVSKKIVHLTFGIICLFLCFLIIYGVDTSQRWFSSYTPETWLILLYFYQIFEFFACMVMCYMTYTVFPPLPSAPSSTEGSYHQFLQRHHKSLGSGDKATQNEATPLMIHHNRNLERRMSINRSNLSSNSELESDGELPFAWDVDDLNFSAYYKVWAKSSANEIDSMLSSEDFSSIVEELNFTDILSSENPDDSFANYWAI